MSWVRWRFFYENLITSPNFGLYETMSFPRSDAGIPFAREIAHVKPGNYTML